MEIIRLCLWGLSIVAIAFCAFSLWKLRAANEEVFASMMLHLTEEKLQDMQEKVSERNFTQQSAEVEQSEDVVRVGTFNVVEGPGLGQHDNGEFFKYDYETGEEIPYSPTETEAKQFEAIVTAAYWEDFSRNSRIAATLFLLSAITFQIGSRFLVD